MEGKIEGLRNEWEGFKNVPDAQLREAIVEFEKGNTGVLSGVAGQGGQPTASVQGNPYTRGTPYSPVSPVAPNVNGGPLNIPADIGGPDARFQQADQVTATVDHYLNTAKADDLSDPLGQLTDYIQSRPDKDKVNTAADGAKAAFDKIGGDKGGTWDESASLPVITGEIERIRNKWQVPYDVAAQVVANAIGQNANWFRPDTRYINSEEIDKQLKEYSGGKGLMEGAVSRFRERSESKTAQANLAQFKEEIKKANDEFAKKYEAAIRNGNITGAGDLALRHKVQMDQLQKKVVGSAEPISRNLSRKSEALKAEAQQAATVTAQRQAAQAAAGSGASRIGIPIPTATVIRPMPNAEAVERMNIPPEALSGWPTIQFRR
jgi:hypothetical protein